MRRSTASTRASIAALSEKPTSPPWLKLAVWDALHDRPMSYRREVRMCAALGIDPPCEPVPVDPCPDCGQVHTGRCNGVDNPVVVVKPAPRQRTRRKYWRPCLPLELKTEFEQRVFQFESVEDLLRYALSLDWEMRDLGHEW